MSQNGTTNGSLRSDHKPGRRVLRSTEELFQDLLRSRSSEGKNRRNDSKRDNYSNDFRVMSICPTFAEIQCNKQPILRPNVTTGKYSTVDHYLSTHFSLLREDMVRSLRIGINEYINSNRCGKRPQRIQDIRIYEDIRIGKRCDELQSSFWAQSGSERFKRINWTHSKSLIYGSLLCLSSNNFQTFCFASVAGDRHVDELRKGLFQLEFIAESLTEEFKHINPKTTFVMIESEAYFEAYKHNLMALQKLTNTTFPFKDYVVFLKNSVSSPRYINCNTVYELPTNLGQTKTNSYKSVGVMEPKRWPTAQAMGFDDQQYEAYKTALLKEFVLIQGPPGTGKTYIGLKIVQTLHQNRRRINPDQSNKKPIFIICYTNHALDQFLEEMLPFCDNMVRIGGQSKSKLLEKHTMIALREQMKGTAFCPKFINQGLFEAIEELKGLKIDLLTIDSEINNCNEDLLKLQYLYELNPNPWFERQLMSLLTNYSNEMDLALIDWISDCDYEMSTVFQTLNRYEFLNEDNLVVTNSYNSNRVVVEVDEEEVNHVMDSRVKDSKHKAYGKALEEVNETEIKTFNTIFKTNNKSLKSVSKQVINRLKYKMKSQSMSKDMMSYEEAVKITDVSQLSHSNRWRLYWFWIKLYTDFKRKQSQELSQKFNTCLKEFQNLCSLKDMHLILSRDIVGMTTTGAAKFRSTIELIDPKIVVIEEAAEVLESYVITSLTKSTEHLILIGDHRQLRPQTAVYELSQRYHLDVSLFERMVQNGMPFTQLKYQHRMRPQISRLLVPYIYDQLLDHKSVFSYEDIKGLKKNLYFIKHSSLETSNDERKSKSNLFEAQFIVRLAKHLVYQDYSPTQITILTLYSSQLILINDMLRGNDYLKGLRAKVVDNFQGEENDIILLSFVRSNTKSDIGFLKTSNRVNVALSRAKKGLYCVGNFDCLSNGSTLWRRITNHLQNTGAIGTALELSCSNHPKEVINVSTVDNFNTKAPFGGCAKTYSHSMNCGHPCPLNVCHVSDNHLKCREECEKVLSCGHICPQNCHFPEECMNCLIVVKKKVPKCGHSIDEICSGSLFCNHPCVKTLECGHKCDKLCGDECQTQCVVEVDKHIEECGHTVVTKCYKSPVCDNPCGKPLDCGHKCEVKCHKDDCNEANNCLVLVTKAFDNCGHEVYTQCHQDLDSLKCKTKVTLQLVCGHNYRLSCFQSNEFSSVFCNSLLCAEKCNQVLICGHTCMASCVDCNQSRLHRSCQQKCERILICGHNCTGICGENCPPCVKLCQRRCLHGTRDRTCDHTCSQPCIKCLMPCQWKCKHKECTKLCHETCNRDVCPESCPLLLRCGHKCIGICGERCPKLCLICHKSKIKDIIGINDMSDNETQNSKFIELEDCKHVIELNALQTLMTTTDANEDIFKRCPKCEKSITRCQPFNEIIKQQFNRLLKKYISNHCWNEENKPKQQCLSKTVAVMLYRPLTDAIDRNMITKILKELQNETQIECKQHLVLIKSKFQLSMIENKVIVVKNIYNVLKELDSNSPKVWKDFDSTQKQLFFGRIRKFLNYISKDFSNTCQQIRDSEQELRFIVTLSQCLIQSSTGDVRLQNVAIVEKKINLITDAINSGPFTQEMENNFHLNILQTIGYNFELKAIDVKLNANQTND